jgi:cobalt transporter subunit CbtA
MRAMPPVCLATEAALRDFQKLLLLAIVSGTVAGLLWFGAQSVAVIPLIQKAEVYESAHEAAHGTHDEDGEWKPKDGWQRNSLTAIATVLTGIGEAAILFGVVFFSGRRLDARNGALWGLAAFTCLTLAPGLGLPPQPPGVPVASLALRQIWWGATVFATALGLYCIAASRLPWLMRIGGILCLALPHTIGAPQAAGEAVVPEQLVRQFTIASLATSFLFWVVVGIAGGIINEQYAAAPTTTPE